MNVQVPITRKATKMAKKARPMVTAEAETSMKKLRTPRWMASLAVRQVTSL